MSQGKATRKAHADVLKRMPFCIYCGGSEEATSVDHMPPAICFRWKLRPKGLEFSSCQTCNEKASHADMVAGLISRSYDQDRDADHTEEITKLFRSVYTNIPGLLQEMKKPRGAEKIALKRLPKEFAEGLVNVGGPVVGRHMEIFTLKMGLALHFEVTQHPVPADGGIAVRWFTNYQRVVGDMPDDVVDIFPEPKTLVNGKKHVSEQFQYSWRISDDKTFGAYFASFRMSFALVAFVANDRRLLHVPDGKGRVYSPAEVKELITRLQKNMDLTKASFLS